MPDLPLSESGNVKTPTLKQFGQLLGLGSGSAGLSWGKRDTDPLIRRGWVTAEWKMYGKQGYYQMVRITPEGAHALAEGIREYGLPEIGPKPQTTVRACADCGSTRYRLSRMDVDKFDPRKVRCVA